MSVTQQPLKDRLKAKLLEINPDGGDIAEQTSEDLAEAFSAAFIEWLNNDTEYDTTDSPPSGSSFTTVIQDS